MPAVLGHRTTAVDGGDAAASHVPSDLQGSVTPGAYHGDQGDELGGEGVKFSELPLLRVLLIGVDCSGGSLRVSTNSSMWR